MRMELEQVRVRKPCPKGWQELVGEGPKRYCDECGLHVHNLSAMTRSEVDSMLGASTGRACVAYIPEADGTPKVLDYQQPSSVARNKRRWIVGGSLVAVVIAAFQAIAFERKPPTPPPMLMGDVGPCIVPTQPVAKSLTITP